MVEKGITSQSPSMLTCVTPGYPQSFRTKSVAIVYRKIFPDLYWGYEQKATRYNNYLIAEPEKALLDWIYLTRQGELPARFDELQLQFLSPAKLRKYEERFPPRFRQAGARRHADHIEPARLIPRLRVGNPDRRENLQCICGTCHGYKLQADHRLCLGDKLGYLEIRSQNELTGFGFAKDYDAVVTVRTGAVEQRFALEYERSPKPMRYYKDVAAALVREAQVSHVLYLVSNYDLLQFVSGFFRNSRCRVLFGLVKDWHAQLLDMPVSCCSAARSMRLRETLDVATAPPEPAAVPA